VRLAGKPEAIDTLARHVSSQGLLHDGAESGAAELAASHRLDAFFQVYELLLSKGYDASAAQVVAVRMIDGEEPMAKTTRRFAGIYDDPSADAGPSG
tara:strand:+ start:5639 stop:5929 length:291 start_codon:yes stop_codon:yes gene_type:complete